VIESFKKLWINGLNFKDRTSRSDFWFSIFAGIIISLIISFVLGFIGAIFGEIGAIISYVITYVYSLAYFIVCLSMQIRRLHDINKPAWYILMILIPLVGWIFLVITYCTKSVEPNKYGKQV